MAAWVAAPLVVDQAEAALEDAAWAAGRALAIGITLTHLFDVAVGRDRIVADDTAGAEPPPPQTPIVIVPAPDIDAPPRMPRRGGTPPDVKPKRKHRRAVPQGHTPASPPDRQASGFLPAPPVSRSDAGGGAP